MNGLRKKIYKCTQCDHSSMTAQLLRIHMINHTGDKPNKSNKCKYPSKTASDLTKHITRIHTKETNVYSEGFAPTGKP